MVRLENLSRSKWVFPITAKQGKGNKRRTVETKRVVLGPSHNKAKVDLPEEQKKHFPSPYVELTQEQWDELGQANHEMIADLERQGQLEVRR